MIFVLFEKILFKYTSVLKTAVLVHECKIRLSEYTSVLKT